MERLRAGGEMNTNMADVPFPILAQVPSACTFVSDTQMCRRKRITSTLPAIPRHSQQSWTSQNDSPAIPRLFFCGTVEKGHLVAQVSSLSLLGATAGEPTPPPRP